MNSLLPTPECRSYQIPPPLPENQTLSAWPGLDPAALPDMRIVENSNERVIYIQVTGFRKTQLKVRIMEQLLFVEGYSDDSTYLSGIGPSFQRTFALPSRSKTAAITARFLDEILEIKIPKQAVLGWLNTQAPPYNKH